MNRFAVKREPHPRLFVSSNANGDVPTLPTHQHHSAPKPPNACVSRKNHASTHTPRCCCCVFVETQGIPCASARTKNLTLSTTPSSPLPPHTYKPTQLCSTPTTHLGLSNRAAPTKNVQTANSSRALFVSNRPNGFLTSLSYFSANLLLLLQQHITRKLFGCGARTGWLFTRHKSGAPSREARPVC